MLVVSAALSLMTAIAALIYAIAPMFVESKISSDHIAVFLTVSFGTFTVISVLASIAVLHTVKGTIPHWSFVSDRLVEILHRANERVYLLANNPAFLQAFSSKAFQSWAEVAKRRLINGGIEQRFVFVYVRRNYLEKRIKKWANGDTAAELRMQREITNNHIFGWLNSLDPEIAEKIRMVPVDVEDLPFFLAIADMKGTSLFCRAFVSEDIRASNIKGFHTLDGPITEAFNMIFHQTVEHLGGAYEYKCLSCDNHVEYLLDSDIVIRRGAFLVDEIGNESMSVNCPTCNSEMKSPEFVRFMDMSTTNREDVLARIFD